MRKVLAERTPIVLTSKNGTPNIGHSLSSSATDVPNGHRNGDVSHIPRARSVSWGTNSAAAETTAIDSESAIGDDDTSHLDADLLTEEEHNALRIAGEGMLAGITPPNGAREVVQEAVTQHDLLNKFFRGDVIVLSGLDLLRYVYHLFYFEFFGADFVWFSGHRTNSFYSSLRTSLFYRLYHSSTFHPRRSSLCISSTRFSGGSTIPSSSASSSRVNRIQNSSSATF